MIKKWVSTQKMKFLVTLSAVLTGLNIIHGIRHGIRPTLLNSGDQANLYFLGSISWEHSEKWGVQFQMSSCCYLWQERLIFSSQTLHRVIQMQKWIAPLDRAPKTGQEHGMVWYEKVRKVLNQQNKCSFNLKDLEKVSSKHTKPYHFLDQCFKLFPVVPFIFAFEQF